MGVSQSTVTQETYIYTDPLLRSKVFKHTRFALSYLTFTFCTAQHIIAILQIKLKYSYYSNIVPCEEVVIIMQDYLPLHVG